MPPLRVGIIGASSKPCWASMAHLPYLLQAKDDFVIVALCNSTISAAQSAIVYYGLAESTRAYASPSEFAVDPDIDIVLCCVRVDLHYETIAPSVLAGKTCYVEWPLGRDLQEASMLATLAASSSAKVFVGLQARHSPTVNTVKRLIQKHAIGMVESTYLHLVGPMGGAQCPQHLAYMNDASVGAGLLNIPFAHVFDALCYAIGEPHHLQSLTTNQRPRVDIVDENGESIRSETKTAPDHISISSLLTEDESIHCTVTARGGLPATGEKSFSWRIFGDRGIITIQGDSPFCLSIGAPPPVITLEVSGQGSKAEVDANDKEDVFTQLPLESRNVARLWRSFRAGLEVPSLELAVDRHQLLQKMIDAQQLERE